MANTPLPTGWQNNIIAHEDVKASTILANPRNFRVHGEIQQQAMVATFDELGWLDEVLVNRRTGNIIDGHMRVALALAAEGPDATVPVAWCDLSPEQELKALATHDPVGAMAYTDREQFAALADEIAAGDADDLQFLALLQQERPPEVTGEEGLGLDTRPLTGQAGGDGDEVEEEDTRDWDDITDTTPERVAEPEPEPAAAPDPVTPPSRLTALTDVIVSEPIAEVGRGEIWTLGDHVLVCTDVLRDWKRWLPELRRGAGAAAVAPTLFAPYPGPFIPLQIGSRYRLVMVQPDPYVAGRVVDAYVSIYGRAAVAKREQAPQLPVVPVAAPTGWRRRIVGHELVPASQLTANPLNWRIHSMLQQQAMATILDDLGWLDEILVNRRTGFVVDGHMRVALAMRTHGDDTLVPVAWCDLNEREERLALASYDTLTQMADISDTQHRELMTLVGESDQSALDLLRLIEGGRDTPPDETEEQEDDDVGVETGKELSRGTGTMLARCEITIDQPKHVVKHGQVWDVGDHVLACIDVVREWDVWSTLLEATADDGRPTLFAPYPGPFSALTLKADESRLVMVQPDPYLAGHILDNFVAVKGDALTLLPESRKEAA